MGSNGDKEIMTLKVSNKTSVYALTTAAAGYLKSQGIVFVDCIGVAANYIATKAIIQTIAAISCMGLKVNHRPIFKDYVIDEPMDTSSIKTGIRWILSLDS